MAFHNSLRRNFKPHFLVIAASTFSLGNSAHAEHASVQIPRFIPEAEYSASREEVASSLLWLNAPLTQTPKTAQPTELELRQNIRAFIVEDPALGQLYSLRELVKGSSQKQWKISDSSVGELHLALGGQALPAFRLSGVNGSRAAVALTSGHFGLYSTRPLSALNNGLKTADQTLGDAVSNDASQIDWLNARAFSSPHGTVDVVLLRGENDLNPYSTLKTSGQFKSGTMAGAKIAYRLPLQWKMDGEWMTSGVKSSEENSNNQSSILENSAYLLTLAGPIAHPFGQTGVRFSRREVGASFQNFSGTPHDAGVASTQLSLSQPFAVGAISGALELDWAQQLPTQPSASRSTPATADKANLQATSSLRWQATPIVAFTASREIGQNLDTQNSQDSPIYHARRNSVSQVGMEWRVLPSVSLSLSGGETRYDETSDGERFLRRLSNRDNQFSLGLRNQSSRASWDLQLERRAALDLLGETGASTQALSLSAQRRLTSWLQMRGTYRVSQNDDSLNATIALASGLTAAASLSLQELGALELSYSQANNAQNDGVRLNNSLSRGYGARYSYGANAGNGGLGFSIDYSCSAVNNLNDSQWKVGITYR